MLTASFKPIAMQGDSARNIVSRIFPILLQLSNQYSSMISSYQNAIIWTLKQRYIRRHEIDIPKTAFSNLLRCGWVESSHTSAPISNYRYKICRHFQLVVSFHFKNASNGNSNFQINRIRIEMDKYWNNVRFWI